MLEIYSTENLFSFPKEGEAACVTTNGMWRADGDAIMGAGIALEAQKNYMVADLLGKYLQQYGNRVFNLGLHQNLKTGETFRLFSFPTKHNWKLPSRIDLIEKSAKELVEVCEKFGVKKCYLPPAGCTNGKLSYEKNVKPILTELLDNRFICIINKNFVK